MNAITDCVKAIKDITSPNGAEEMRQLGGTFRTGHPPAPCHRQIVRDTRQHHPISSEGAHDNPNDHPFSSEGAKNRNSPTTDTVDSTVTRTRQTTNQTSIFGTNKKTTSAPPMQSTSTSTSWKKRKQRRVAAAHSAPKSTTPAANTRSKTKADAPPATRTCANTKNLGSAAAVMKMNNTVRKYAWGLIKKMEQIGNEVHQAMAIMDKETGQLLNYRQLLRSAKYKKQWSISSANEFGRLANGVGNRIKNPTNTIQFIRKKEIPQDRRKDVTYGSCMCSV
jgi:hypothetical protein